MEKTRQIIEKLGFPGSDFNEIPTSTKTFPDGAQYRIEIPSVEGVKSFETVLDAAEDYDVPIHRVSQGSGIMLLTDSELKDMVGIGASENMEVSLFVGPRGTWDLSAMPWSSGGKVLGQRVEGIDQLVYSIEDIKRGCEAGLRSILVSDEGLLWLVNEYKKLGELPSDLIVKVSVQMGQSNPVSIRLIESIGAGTFNVPTDLTLPRLAAIRQAVDIPLDIYVEVPDELGGFIRHFDIPEIIRVAAPVYIKFGLRNAPNIYPSGTHLEDKSMALSKERVRRARIGLEMIQRYAPHLKMSEKGAEGLAVPVKGNVSLS
ncbi:Peptidase family U32 [Halobacillus karajensis]|uniref:Collagenase n=1 Tax=Halobacillus karajensis TaxID=195088 RepID=A0A024P2J2_9BACI|nr:U32 family peptidase [Halobacillus karajensis]CDQ20025.1 Collagenase [Halobacillus karajensis]CDQ22484.1 Collagenase [Halobacillus karajensis]CDQ28328.1 Collagenase [Halobacillus karajensis]SEH67912.1 Peptidase family U32 [Halobacillus karajensis]